MRNEGRKGGGCTTTSSLDRQRQQTITPRVSDPDPDSTRSVDPYLKRAKITHRKNSEILSFEVLDVLF
jgi:hypothetical protein